MKKIFFLIFGLLVVNRLSATPVSIVIDRDTPPVKFECSVEFEKESGDDGYRTCNIFAEQDGKKVHIAKQYDQGRVYDKEMKKFVTLQHDEKSCVCSDNLKISRGYVTKEGNKLFPRKFTPYPVNDVKVQGKKNSFICAYDDKSILNEYGKILGTQCNYYALKKNEKGEIDFSNPILLYQEPTADLKFIMDCTCKDDMTLPSVTQAGIEYFKSGAQAKDCQLVMSAKDNETGKYFCVFSENGSEHVHDAMMSNCDHVCDKDFVRKAGCLKK